MQIRDLPASSESTSLDESQGALPARFRVVVRRSCGVKCIVSLARYREDAEAVARRFCDAVLNRDNSSPQAKTRQHGGIAAVVVEEWVGTLTVGRWKLLNGGFCWIFKPANGTARSFPKSGDQVVCVLLSEKTRKKGWKAKLVDRDLAGPITNTNDVPKSATPGQNVKLRVGAISANKNRIQFDWLPLPADVGSERSS